jgi:SPP1 gp7 family putative phage head morphogenesis protein
MYNEIARNISSYAGISQNNAVRIARTEGHRIQCKATADAQWKAKSKGADVVKQWDSALDSKTRKSHRELDGQIRELEEEFEVNGHKAMHPGDFNIAKEDINCRCALLQRARWALEEEHPATKWAEDAPVLISDDGTTQFVDISDAKNYKQFKERYQQQVMQGAQKMNDENASLEKAIDKEPLLSHDIADIDYRAEKVTFKDLQEWKKSIGNVTDEEYSIIDGMNDAGYIHTPNSYKINKAMREGNIQDLSENSQKTIEVLKEVINKNTSDRDAVLIRKVGKDYLESVYDVKSTELKDIVDELNAKKIGEINIEKGFVSTSYKANKNLNNNDEVELEIFAPKGTNMLLTKNRQESEIILQANTHFELEGAVLTDDGKARLLMKVVPNDIVEETLENVGKNSTIDIDEMIVSYLENPKALGETTHKEKYDEFVKNGVDVKPLKKGDLKNVSYEDGGGYKVNGTQDGRYLQYHPEKNSHHDGEYYKLSSGKTGTKRYDMNGELIE